MLEQILAGAGKEATKTIISKLPGLWKQKKPSSLPKEMELQDFREYDRRLETNRPAKERIARAVTDRIILKDNLTCESPILLDSGSVTYCVAVQLMERGKCQVVTNNIATCFEAKNKMHPVRIHVLPGEFNTAVVASTGPETARVATEQLVSGVDGLPKSKIAVLGLRSFCPQRGFAEDTHSLRRFQAALFEYADQLVVVAQGEKFLNKARVPILPAREFRATLDSRIRNKSIWFVFHEPTKDLTDDQRSFYENNIQELIRQLPQDHVINATAY